MKITYVIGSESTYWEDFQSRNPGIAEEIIVSCAEPFFELTLEWRYLSGDFGEPKYKHPWVKVSGECWGVFYDLHDFFDELAQERGKYGDRVPEDGLQPEQLIDLMKFFEWEDVTKRPQKTVLVPESDIDEEYLEEYVEAVYETLKDSLVPDLSDDKEVTVKQMIRNALTSGG